MITTGVGRIIPFGYKEDKGAQSRLMDIMEEEHTVIVETRYRALARGRASFCKSGLERVYGERYIAFRDAYKHNKLGNVNYQDHAIEPRLVDESGIIELVALLRTGKSVVLLCTCPEDYERCHRRLIIRLLVERMPELKIVQW
jgi:hypothetical protein